MSLPPPVTWRIERHERLASTNDHAIAAAEAGAAPGLIVLAEEQTAGRGRRGRAWQSRRGNLHCSLLLPAEASPLGGAASLLAGLAAHDAISPFVASPLACRLKWPNDLMVGAAKLGGILVEGGTTAAGESWLVAGIGINLAHHPDGLDRRVTSLAALGVAPPPPETVAGLLAEAMAQRLAAFRAGGLAPLLDAWSSRAIAAGTPITVQGTSGALAGRYAGLDHDGALLLATEAGTRRVVAGDVCAEV
jgi:BirA family biotin operon repressor/biotin-[acetyl-CoA-carboxylase] ligase